MRQLSVEFGHFVDVGGSDDGEVARLRDSLLVARYEIEPPLFMRLNSARILASDVPAGLTSR